MSDVRTFLDRFADGSGSTWILAALTDEYLIDKLSPDNTQNIIHKLCGSEKKVLEIRIFNQEKEHRLFRSDAGSAVFAVRSIYDAGDGKDLRDHYDDIQYLDIDETRGHLNGYVYTTGGGRYYLPVNNIHDVKVRIRYYLDRYPETGQARIADWRLVEFKEGKNAI